MQVDYQKLELPYVRSTDQSASEPVRHAVIVVGAGPVGLTTAIDLAQQGVRVVVLDDDNKLSVGSRAICFAKRTLEIWDRLGCGERMVEKGVSWNVGKVFFQDEHVYSFNLLPESGHPRPAFINLQQYYAEGYLYERAKALPNLDLRWKHKVIAVTPKPDGVELTVETPDGQYTVQAAYLIACDGARSPVRKALDLESKGRIFRDRFLIADVKMKAEFPAERWFWFDPPFHRNQSVLLHMQPDNVWRIDFQLGWDADPEEEKKPEKVIPRIKALLGPQAQFDLEWVSVYTFACERMEQFRHGRVIFAGDAAHRVSPFGARGANSGVQDADNLVWKLRLVLEGRAPDRLLDTYGVEREYAADENLLNSTRATDFITPKSDVSRVFRDAVLKLSKEHPFARRFVNSGRLSLPATLIDSPLNTPDRDPFTGTMVPGAPVTDAPVAVNGEADWFLAQTGTGFTVVYFSDGTALPPATAEALNRLAQGAITVTPLVVVPNGSLPKLPHGLSAIEDSEGWLAQRFDACPGTVYVLRPDQHVCARWRQFDADRVRAAIARATCNA
ncbi:MAG TPA: FAD-dependent oxidoreductase [Burkholderiaceae bacterium]|nr:FAD-dependent oxidoreductase [Burkholderiaceae bacterium]